MKNIHQFLPDFAMAMIYLLGNRQRQFCFLEPGRYAAWCNEHGISPSCFYNAVTRLRKKACQIPDPVGKASTLDLTSHKQDVVQIAIEPESSPAELIPDNGNRPMHLDNSHTIEIEADGLLIRMSNEIKPLLLKMLMDTLKESLC